jgi:TRAP-type transport system periplasmic protein
MNRRVPLLLSGFVGALCLAVAGAAVAQPEFRLRWGHYLAEGPFVQMEKEFANRIEQRTEGRVKIDITYAGGLGRGTELLLLVGRGAVDMSSTPPGYNPDQLHYWRAFQIPFVFSTARQAMEVLGKVVEEFPVYREEMDRLGVVWLFQQPLGEYYMSGPSPDCDSVDKLRGKKVRSFGADIPKAHNAIGAVPVTVNPTELYEALQRGTIDYSFINAGNIQQYRLWEVAKYNCGPLTAITGHNITIGKRTWARLPADIQEIFLEEARKIHQEYTEWLDGFETEAVRNMKEQGAVFIEFPAEELEKWKEATPDLLAEWEEATAAATGDAETPAKVAARWRELTAD